jgi:hypothetical protein
MARATAPVLTLLRLQVGNVGPRCDDEANMLRTASATWLRSLDSRQRDDFISLSHVRGTVGLFERQRRRPRVSTPDESHAYSRGGFW